MCNHLKQNCIWESSGSWRTFRGKSFFRHAFKLLFFYKRSSSSLCLHNLSIIIMPPERRPLRFIQTTRLPPLTPLINRPQILPIYATPPLSLQLSAPSLSLLLPPSRLLYDEKLLTHLIPMRKSSTFPHTVNDRQDFYTLFDMDYIEQSEDGHIIASCWVRTPSHLHTSLSYFISGLARVSKEKHILLALPHFLPKIPSVTRWSIPVEEPGSQMANVSQFQNRFAVSS